MNGCLLVVVLFISVMLVVICCQLETINHNIVQQNTVGYHIASYEETP